MKLGSSSPKSKKGTPKAPRKRGSSKRDVLLKKKSLSKRSHRGSSSLKWRLCKSFLLIGIWGFLGVSLFVGYCAYDLPKLEGLIQGTRKQSIILYSADGELLCRYGEAQKPLKTLADVSPFVLQSILAIEDRKFYAHSGVDFMGLLRALGVNLSRGGLVQGGSTLSQQLAKTLFLTRAKNIKRKVQELMLALWLEQKFSKDHLFLIYLNRVYWGSGSYGIGAAASTYFNKDPKQLTLYESALVAGLLKAPSSLSPFSSMERAQKRTRLVLTALVEMGAISTEQKTQALREENRVFQGIGQRCGIRYFGDWIIQQAREILGPKLQGDLKVVTTLDGRLQSKAGAKLNEALMTAFGSQTSQEGAILALSYQGAVRAMIGGKSYGESQFNRVTQAQRQPGSLFKVIVFLEAFCQGMTPDSVISDGPIRIGKWAPKNYHWASKGTVSLREAFVRSINTATVRLAQKVVLKNVHKRALSMGIKTSLPHDLTIALGSGEVTLLEMTTVFARIASGYETLSPYGIIKIMDFKNRVLYAHNSSLLPFDKTEAPAMMRRLLVDVVEGGTGRGAAIPGVEVGGKTGTSQGKKDALFIGFTPTLIGGIWVGYEGSISSGPKGTMGAKVPARLFSQIFG